jgi:hypothetical protein
MERSFDPFAAAAFDGPGFCGRDETLRRFPIR